MKAWLESRSPRNRNARSLLRALAYAEATRGFQLICAYARTYHNDTADLFSRCSPEEFDGLLKERNMTQVSLAEPWKQAVETCMQQKIPVLFGLDPEDKSVGEDLRRRWAERLHGTNTIDVSQTVLWTDGNSACDWKESCTLLGGLLETPAEGTTTTIGVSSVGPDGSGAEAATWAERALGAKCERIIVEGLQDHPTGPLERLLENASGSAP